MATTTPSERLLCTNNASVPDAAPKGLLKFAADIADKEKANGITKEEDYL